MKKIKLSMLFAAIIVLPMIYFTGCSDKSEVTSPNQVNFDSPQFAMIDYFDVENAIEDLTIDKEMVINNNLFGYGFMNNMNPMTPGNPNFKGNPWLEKFDFGKHLGLFFKRLNLSDEQKTQLKDLMVKFHDDMKPLVQQFKDANADIIKAANESRKAILEQVKGGTLTREEAKAQLKTLNDTIRDQIKNNPASQVIKDNMCVLRTTLFDGIAGNLTGDQVTKWNDFSSKIPNPCK